MAQPEPIEHDSGTGTTRGFTPRVGPKARFVTLTVSPTEAYCWDDLDRTFVGEKEHVATASAITNALEATWRDWCQDYLRREPDNASQSVRQTIKLEDAHDHHDRHG